MNKRDFIKTGIAAMGCAACAFYRTDLLAAGFGRLQSPPPAGDLWKWSHEAYHYTVTPEGVHCTNCPNGCTLDRNETSRCRSRVNYQGKLYSIAYGNPCAVHIDPIEKKPLLHFLPSSRAYSIATAGCNLACLNCQNWEISQRSPRETTNFDLMPAQVVEECRKNGCESIAYTYSEPTTFYEYVHDTARLARTAGIKNVYKSNGYINEKPLRQLCKYLDAANIDLKGFTDSSYRKLNSGMLAPVLRSLKVLKEEGVWLEITNPVIPSWTDDLPTIRQMCNWLVTNNLDDCPLHFSRFSPLYKLTQLPATPLAILQKAREIALETGMKYVYVGNVPEAELENTYCPKCKKLLVKRKGFRVMENLLKNGKCSYCGSPVAGIWNL